MIHRTVSAVLLGLIALTNAFAYNSPIGIPDPASNFEGFNPIDAPKPDPRVYAPAWFLATPRANSIASGDAHDAYYVDNTAPGATDTSNPYGSPTKPRLTIPLVDFSAGAYVEIHGNGGTARYSAALRPAGVGTASAPIWFVGVNRPVITATCDIGYASRKTISYLIFDGLEWRDGGRIVLRPRYDNNDFHHIVFRNCVIRGTGTSNDSTGVAVGAAVLTTTTRTVSNVVLHNCEISHFGDKAAPGEECGLYPGFFVTNLWLLDSKVHDMAEDGVAGSHGGKRTSTGYYIGRSEIYDNVTNGIDIKGMGTVVISQCNIHGHRANTPNATGAGENIVLHYSGDSTPGSSVDTYKNWPEDVSVLHNKIHDGDYGVLCSTIDRFRAVGNVFYDLKHSTSTWSGSSSYASGTAIHMRGIRGNAYVVNNTIYNCDNGIQWPDGAGAYSSSTTYFKGSLVYYPATAKAYVFFGDDRWPTGVSGVAPTNTSYWREVRTQIWGNIIANRAQAAGRDINIPVAERANNTLDFDYNLIYSPSGSSIAFGSSTVRTVSWLRTNTNAMKHGLDAAPGFVDPSTLNFALTAQSPAIDTSSEGAPSGYTDYESYLGVGIRRDFRGEIRPMNNLWDMGSFEFDGTVSSPTTTPTAPNAPSNLRKT